MHAESPKSPQKMKLLWFCYSRILESGETFGSERIERVRHLAEEGHEEHLIAAYFNKERFAILNNPRLHFVSIPMKYKPLISTVLYGLFLFFFGPFYLAKYRPDVAISDHTTTPFLIWHPLLSRLLRFKTILDVRSTPVGGGARATLHARVQFRISVWIAKSIFNGITVVTPMMRDEICRSFKINPEWTAVLSNGISDEVFSPEKEKNTSKAFRAQLGLSKKFVIIYHGSFRQNGGLVESVQAIALLKESHPDVVLYLLGSSTKGVADLLKHTIQESNVEKNVIQHAPVEFHEVPKFIAMSDLGLVPLPNIPFWRYQQPIKLLEYMAMNKAFIVSESPAHRIIISNSKNAIYIQKVTPPEIAKAIEYAYNNRDKLDEWGQTGRSVVMERYIWKKVNEELMIYLRNVQLGETGSATLKR
jgi:glycosyltransferase involved in cell wall biosynthesis